MLLICLLSVMLVFGGLAFRRELTSFYTDVRLSLFGARVPVRKVPQPLGSVPPQEARHSWGPPAPPGPGRRPGS